MKKITLLIVLFGITNTIQSQHRSDLIVKGFSQSAYQRMKINYLDKTLSNYNGFFQQQTNIMLEKQVDTQIKGFFNIEFTNNQDHENKFGNLTLEEAWVSYHYNKYHHFRVGKMIPEFGVFNTIRNRIPISPFITRPIIFESLFNAGFNVEEYVPKYAFFEYRFTESISNALKFEVFTSVGNSANNMLVSDDDVNPYNGIFSGQDTTLNLSFNTKLNFNYVKPEFGILDFGVSASRDVNQIYNHSDVVQQPNMGNVVRYRGVIHLKIRTIKNEIISEYYRNFYDVNNHQKEILNEMVSTQRSLGIPLRQTSNNQSSFFYVMGIRRINNKVRVYGRYGHFNSVFNGILRSGLNIYTLGGEYRINNLSFKTEFITSHNRNDDYILNPEIKNVYFIRAFRIGTSINF